MAKNNSDDNNGLGCALLLVAIVFAMPLVGIYLIVKGSDEDKSVGIALLILGIVLWGYILTHMD
ncbi:MAG: hypothetical protein SOR79_02040 [Blautia sp.]|uniref:hypothetical protein n=1 Tax=Blautia sp. TaxID=1955243 RepID=UPI002A7482B1|nr:hypothetical protein [Blautia sp.]MDY3015914.1 hypothetical protein [Blautia sp.]